MEWIYISHYICLYESNPGEIYPRLPVTCKGGVLAGFDAGGDTAPVEISNSHVNALHSPNNPFYSRETETQRSWHSAKPMGPVFQEGAEMGSKAGLPSVLSL